MSKKATEYAVVVWEKKPVDWPMLGCPDEEHSVDTLPEAVRLYEDILRDDIVGPAFYVQLHHYYEVDTKGWESASNVLMEERLDGEEDYFPIKARPVMWSVKGDDNNGFVYGIEYMNGGHVGGVEEVADCEWFVSETMRDTVLKEYLEEFAEEGEE